MQRVGRRDHSLAEITAICDEEIQELTHGGFPRGRTGSLRFDRGFSGCCCGGRLMTLCHESGGRETRNANYGMPPRLGASIVQRKRPWSFSGEMACKNNESCLVSRLQRLLEESRVYGLLVGLSYQRDYAAVGGVHPLLRHPII